MVLLERYCPHCGAASALAESVCSACGTSLKATLPLNDELYPALRLSYHLRENQLFKERYRIIRRVGSGGFGAVYQAEDTLENRHVAIKEIGLAGLTPQQMIEATGSFNREFQMLSNLNYPSIPHVYEQLTDAEHWYLVMDFIAGETLEERLARATGGCLSLAETLQIGIQICSVLNYLHHLQPHVIFRDIKPTNIMLTPEKKLYLIDFGVARQYKPGKTKDTIAFGSPGYAAPEQYGRAQTTPGADIYSLGALLHQMLSGHDPSLNPLHFRLLHTYSKNLPSELEKLVTQMLESEIERRPENIEEVKRRLQAIYSSRAVTRRRRPALITPSFSPLLAASARSFSTRGVTVGIYQGHEAEIHTLVWSLDGQFIASCDNMQVIHIWNALQPRPVRPWLLSPRTKGQSRPLYSLAWSSNGQMVAAVRDGLKVCLGRLDKRLHWWQMLARSLGWHWYNYTGHTWEVSALAISPDGLKVASADDGGAVHVWDALGTEPPLIAYGHSERVWAVAWSPNGSRVASASLDRTVRVWNPRNGQYLWKWHFDKHTTIYALAWSPDGCSLACGTTDGLVHVWDVVLNRETYTYRGHKKTITAVAWSPNGQWIASASSDHTVHMWEALNGKDAFIYRSHSEKVTAVAWSPDGQHIASVDKHALVHVWKTA